MKNTNRALLSSVVALILCCSMLIGSTFAWFTDEVTSGVNTIQAGNLDIELVDKNGDDLTEALAFVDANGNTNVLWEPGATFNTQEFAIKNKGNLAVKYEIIVKGAKGDLKLLEAIDFTLDGKDVNVTGTTFTGKLGAGESTGLMTLSGHMDENAGNEYQGLKLEGITLLIKANQDAVENDSFDNQYDANAPYPVAAVTDLGALKVNVTGYGPVLLDAAFQFEPTESYEQAQKSEFRYYHADYVVYADQDIAISNIMLAGFYTAFADHTQNPDWIGIYDEDSTETIKAGDTVRLVEYLGATVNYEEICKWGNDGIGFQCGLADISAAGNALNGVTIYVELRVYETTGDPTTVDGPKNEETGEYITLGTYTHTFSDNKMISDRASFEYALNNGETQITLTGDMTLENQIVIPENSAAVLDLNGHDISASYEGTDHYAMFKIPATSSLTVKGEGNVNASTKATESNRSLAIFQNAGKLTIEGGSYKLADYTEGKSWIIATIVDNRTSNASCEAVLTINGGEFVLGGNAKNLFRNYPQQGGSATIIFNGGEFQANPAHATTYIWNQEANNYVGELYFNGGVFADGVVYEDYNGQSDIHFANGVVVPGYAGNN